MIRKKKNTKIVASFMTALILASCTKVEPRHFAEANHVFTSDLKDVELGVKPVNGADLLKKVSASPEMKTGELFRSIQGLYALSNQFNKPSLKSLAVGINNQFYSTMNTNAKIRLEESPFVQAAMGIGKPYLDLGPVILNLFDQKTAKYAWPKNVKLSEFGNESVKFGDWVITQLQAAKVDASVVTAIKEQVFDQILGPRQGNVNDSLASVSQSTSATDKMSNLSDLVDAVALDLTDPALADLKTYMASATSLATQVDAIKDQTTAASTLAAAKKIFSDSELSAIKPNATPDEVKASLISVIETSTEAKIEKAASDVSLPKLPDQIIGFLSSQSGINAARLRALLADPVGEIKKIVANFASTQLATAPAGINGVEADSVQIAVQANTLKIAAGSPTKDIKTSAEALGSSISNSITQVLDYDKQNSSDIALAAQSKSSIISQLNKLVLMCGYKTADNKVSSYTTAQDDSQTPVLLLDSSNQTSKVAAVTDGVTISKTLSPTSVDKSVSVRGQAVLLKGLSDLIAYLRDWEQNGYDKGLGNITASQILQIDPANVSIEKFKAILTKPVFDKSLMFSFAILNAATILQNTKKDLSPFYLMSPTEVPVWLNELPLKDKDGKPIQDTRATAGIVDIVNGQRTSITHTGDLARYMIAITTFLKATDGIENTKASELQKSAPGEKQTYLDKLTQARTDLKTLLMALANMMSNTLEQKDGSMFDQFDKDQLKASGQASALNTALAIEALVGAGEEIGAEAYNTAALNAYYSMNKNLWNKNIQFYTNDPTSGAVPSYDELVSILSSINTLAPHLSDDSKKQWTVILNNWVSALDLLATNLQAANH